MRLVSTAAVVLAAMVLTACAGNGVQAYGLKTNVNTMQDVRNRIGMPSNIRFDGNGNEIWEYNNNPTGYFAYRFVFDQNNVIREGRRFRVQDDQWRVRRGMTAQEVTAIMGEPSAVYFIRGSRHWEWRVHRAGSMQHRMVTQFDFDGKVLSSVFIGTTYRGSSAALAHGGMTP